MIYKQLMLGVVNIINQSIMAIVMVDRVKSFQIVKMNLIDFQNQEKKVEKVFHPWFVWLCR